VSGQDSFSAAEDMPQLKFENCGVFFIKIEFVENLINLNKIDSVRKLLLLYNYVVMTTKDSFVTIQET
jgi:hypothetical protein